MDSDILDLQVSSRTEAIIKVIGVGGGGGNAVNHMFREGIHDVSFALCNTDNQALISSPVPVKIQLGQQTTGGLGAGNKPDVAQRAAEESVELIQDLLSDGTRMAFITAGMGGGTGTGAAPVVARIAKEMGILTVGIVTIPFVFEGQRKIVQALKGVEQIAANVDALLVINNERLRDIYHDLTMLNAFARADDTLATAAKSIAEIITIHGHVNLDFADVETTLKDGGVAIMSRGIGSGKDRVNRAIEDAINSPLLNNNDVFSAKKILINLSFGEENPLMMEEMNALHDFMSKFSHEIEVIWGAAVEKDLGEEVKVTLLATGFSITDVPGIEEQHRAQSKAEELERKIKEDQRRKEEEEEQRLIDKYYGTLGLKMLSASSYKFEPIILSMDELDDDKVLEALEKTPVFKRDREFNPRAFRVESRLPGSLFD
ncbi:MULTISPECIES: cell division protein FtsZ [Petrimonas]|jgi:cell division protein FtsZ|uniref:Cell division protein FtsZ n=2 Tax=Petrimonas mucosa TaxID=1642646 RepID=A0A1G4G9Z5_9BACT|nr:MULTISPECIES: cell division protein FtsZ [Petrimonas]MDD3559887.1 cell division protein FtsZ [Petrimonas mucosa]SCM59369.1 Cell division protein FtsZ {ECO:0000255/HAMAP-Rule:MF_00909} [Petrimonas mucosa]SFU51186.1 cell division protein FtsZ [Porphyromonadaceae bacterium KHP3R9]HHT29965.1 cell division protein FtsZ [Petrimonas mucosa]